MECYEYLYLNKNRFRTKIAVDLISPGRIIQHCPVDHYPRSKFNFFFMRKTHSLKHIAYA